MGITLLRWEDIRSDFLLLLNLRGWRRLAEDRYIWRRAIEETSARIGLLRHWRRWWSCTKKIHSKCFAGSYTSSSLLRGRPGPPFLHRQPSFLNFRYHSAFEFLEGPSFPRVGWYRFWIIVADFVASYQKQHCSFCCAVDMFCKSSWQHQFAAGSRTTALPGNLKHWICCYVLSNFRKISAWNRPGGGNTQRM